MGIPTEFNPDLALRAFGAKGRTIEECLPEKLEEICIIYDAALIIASTAI